jgi:hypothetical protein
MKSMSLICMGHVAVTDLMLNVHEIIDDKSERRMSLGGLRRKFKDNINCILKKQDRIFRLKS